MGVSVCIITYNHEKYIDTALNSVLKQKTNFNYEIVIGEDVSVDNTRRKCIEYQKNNNLIRLLESKENIGTNKNLLRTLKAANGEYLCILEGDDFWTYQRLALGAEHDPVASVLEVDPLDLLGTAPDGDQGRFVDEVGEVGAAHARCRLGHGLHVDVGAHPLVA